ncbi:halocarboxylic acid dehydrogenase DehI family protein [Litchfieldia salsa]|uniref:Halocarboxylic acid dehydrogenase DehI n=1 Tax=Litchfieldia salsa TaxID=930152 RepID=A0A1H0Q5M4_9BACI|nr:halocarboxylic acid dehydrogenase DehI family protein [Litchfieldia salsa]SDP12450.1 Halocarboxylic acid dehydrogenase DehI [Litchfieldia salsa]
MFKPQFGIPEIFESQAHGMLETIYEDIKFVLKVPIVNFVFRTLAYYETFLQLSWNQVRPNLLTRNLEFSASQLRYPKISFQPSEIKWNQMYSDETVQTIKKTLFIFNYVNPKLLVITTSWQEALGYRPINGGATNEGFIQPGVIPDLPKPELIHIPSASIRTKNLLSDIIDKKKSYDAASDYRALAYFPGFLTRAWPSIKEYIGTSEYTLLGEEIKNKARKLVHEKSPYPVTLSSEFLQTFYSPKEVAGIMGIISMFTTHISDLIIEGECLRRTIDGEPS